MNLLSQRSQSRETSTSASCIDHIWGNVLSKRAMNYSFGPADHYLCECVLMLPKLLKENERSFFTRNLKVFNNLDNRLRLEFLMSQKLRNIAFSDTDPNTAIVKLNEVITYCFDRFCPLTKIKRARKNWVTNQVLRASRKRNALYKIYIKNPTIDNFEQFKISRNKCNALSRKAYRAYWRTKLENADPKQYHTTISNIIGSKRKLILPDNFDSNVANDMNKFFAHIGTELNAKIEKVEKVPIERQPQSLFFSEINYNEVENVIINMQSKNSYGHDGISSKMLKICCPLISEPLTNVFNNCVKTGIFPDEFKVAKVNPLHKDGNVNEYGNYRPISLLPSLAKVFERIIYNRIINYFEHFELLNANQFGFRSKLNTVDAALRLVEEIRNMKNLKKDPLMLLLDLQKAFDSVDHSILLGKLENYGIRGCNFCLLKNYLSERYQYIHINNTVSTKRQVKCGVPQGSVLGPLMFLIYINDLPHAVFNSSVTLFADDTAIVKNPLASNEEFQKDIERVDHWMKYNKVTVKATKSKLLRFCSAKDDISLKFSDDFLISVDSCKYLGIWLDNKLSFRQHIEYIRKKMNKFCAIVYKLRDVMTINQLINYYKMYVQPVLQYGILIYGCVKKSNLYVIHKSQKRFFRIVFRKRYRDSISDKLEKLKIASVFELHIYELFKRVVNKKEISQCGKCYVTRAKESGINSLPINKCKAKQLSVDFRTICLANLLKKANIEIQTSFKSENSKNAYLHDFRDNFIIGNLELANIIFK